MKQEKFETGILSFNSVNSLLKGLKKSNHNNLSGEESIEAYNLRIGLDQLCSTLKNLDKEKRIPITGGAIFAEGEIDFSKGKTRALQVIENIFPDDELLRSKLRRSVSLKSIAKYKKFRIYSFSKNPIAERDLLWFLKEQKVVCVGVLGLFLLFESSFEYNYELCERSTEEYIEKDYLRLPQFYTLISPETDLHSIRMDYEILYRNKNRYGSGAGYESRTGGTNSGALHDELILTFCE